jgi:hypothetical protein
MEPEEAARCLDEASNACFDIDGGALILLEFDTCTREGEVMVGETVVGAGWESATELTWTSSS